MTAAWMKTPLHGAGRIERVVGEYRIWDIARVPNASYWIKVVQCGERDFHASPNIAVRNLDGTPDWIGGGGTTEVEALENALASLAGEFDKLGGDVDPARFEWADPRDF